jgi:serine/threonine protein kinase
MVFTEKCDVYSFGVVTMEAVMGKHPKRSTSILLANRAELQSWILDQRITSPTNAEERDIILLLLLLSGG